MISPLNKTLENIGSLFPDSNKADTYIGTIVYAFPWLNVYVVQPISDGVSHRSMEVVSGSDTTSHAGTVFTTYTIGSSVIVCTDKNNHGSLALTSYIIGPASVGNNIDEITPDNTVAPAAKLEPILKKVFDTIRSMCGSLYINVKKKFVQPNDILCGDTSIISSPGNGISVLKHLTRIHCGKGCYVELDSILSRLRIVTEKLEYIGPLRYYQDLSGRGSLLEYNQTALTYEEGTLGISDDSEKLPVFRKKDVSGDITSGWQTSISVPDISAGRSDDVFSSKVRYDGSATMASAKGFEIKKTLDIVSPYQKVETEGLGTIIKEVEDFPDLPNNYTKGDDALLRDKSLRMKQDAETAVKSEYPRVLANPDTWGLSSENRSETVKSAVENERKLPLLNNTQQYDLPDTVTLKDPHTGKEYTYFKSESGFRQDPDGSLVLYDGYGSEIRMTRGNIIISPAGDIMLRPGRDLHTMAGRHIAMVAQQDNIIHSSNRDVYVKGNRNINMLSGINKSGKIIIDDRGDGVLVRSMSKTSMVSPDVFVGNTSSDISSLSSGYSKGSGKVVIGGGDNTLVTGTVIALTGESIDSIALKQGSKHISWVSMDTSRIITISSNNYISGETNIGHISGVLHASVGNAIISAGNQSKNSTLCIQANVDACYGINCRQLWAEQVIGVRMYAGNAHRDSGIKSQVRTPDISSDTPTMTQTNQIFAMHGGAWSDSFTLSNQFKYPSSSELNTVGDKYIIPGILWQNYLTGGKLWNEGTIPNLQDNSNVSMVYPGLESWNGQVTVGSGELKSIIGGYKING